MATVTARANLVILNRGADMFFFGQNVAAPLGTYAAKDLAAAIDALGDDVIRVEYRTVSDPKEREKDRKKFTRRLEGLTGWSRTEWSPRVIDGHTHPDTMQCVLTRITES